MVSNLYPSVTYLCVPDSSLQSLSEREGWTAKEDTFFLRNQEEHIKPKKIITRIEFDSECHSTVTSVDLTLITVHACFNFTIKGKLVIKVRLCLVGNRPCVMEPRCNSV